ncbi:MAG: hypothetical protein M0R77_07845 [Gammaproteobacteria bacterium]|nr:hypothetical protein [Gammaproteobacteria bacterium]
MSSVKHALKAVIYDKRGRVLSVGENSYTKTHRVQAEYAERAGTPHKIYLHAEAAAILKCRDLSKAHRIFVSRTNKRGDFLLAKPCPACELMIKESGIKVVEWSVGE